MRLMSRKKASSSHSASCTSTYFSSYEAKFDIFPIKRNHGTCLTFNEYIPKSLSSFLYPNSRNKYPINMLFYQSYQSRYQSSNIIKCHIPNMNLFRWVLCSKFWVIFFFFKEKNIYMFFFWKRTFNTPFISNNNKSSTCLKISIKLLLFPLLIYAYSGKQITNVYNKWNFEKFRNKMKLNAQKIMQCPRSKVSFKNAYFCW